MSRVLWGSVYAGEHTLGLPSFDCIPLNMRRDRAEKEKKKSKQVPLPPSGFLSQKIKTECDAVLQTFEADFFSFFFFSCADAGGLRHLEGKNLTLALALLSNLSKEEASVCA